MKVLTSGICRRIVDCDLAVRRAAHRLSLVVVVVARRRRLFEPLSHRHFVFSSLLEATAASQTTQRSHRLATEQPQETCFLVCFCFLFFIQLHFKFTRDSQCRRRDADQHNERQRRRRRRRVATPRLGSRHCRKQTAIVGRRRRLAAVGHGRALWRRGERLDDVDGRHGRIDTADAARHRRLVQVAANGAIRRRELLAGAVGRVDADTGGAVGRLAIGACTALVGVGKLANADIAANHKQSLVHVGRGGDGARRKVTISAIRFDGALTILSSTEK